MDIFHLRLDSAYNVSITQVSDFCVALCSRVPSALNIFANAFIHTIQKIHVHSYHPKHSFQPEGSPRRSDRRRFTGTQARAKYSTSLINYVFEARQSDAIPISIIYSTNDDTRTQIQKLVAEWDKELAKNPQKPSLWSAFIPIYNGLVFEKDRTSHSITCQYKFALF